MAVSAAIVRAVLLTLLLTSLAAAVFLVVYGRRHPCEDCWRKMERAAGGSDPVDVPLGATRADDS